jgi:hypothetical protein
VNTFKPNQYAFLNKPLQSTILKKLAVPSTGNSQCIHACFTSLLVPSRMRLGERCRGARKSTAAISHAVSSMIQPEFATTSLGAKENEMALPMYLRCCCVIPSKGRQSKMCRWCQHQSCYCVVVWICVVRGISDCVATFVDVVAT